MALKALLLGILSSLVYAIDNGLGARPGLGWNSDYCTFCTRASKDNKLGGALTGFQNEAFIKHIATYLNTSGLAALGYTNVNMDSLWNLPTRDANGDLMPDPSIWPSGFDYIIDFVHSFNLGFGVYGDRGTLDCNRNPGQLGHETQDAAFFAKHKIDWFKSDSCYASPDHQTAFSEYATMRDALNKTGRAIWFALCGWESYYAWEAPGKALGNSWRVGMDTGGGWGPVMSNVGAMLRGGPNGSSLAPYGRPGAWNDMSLLLNPGMGSGPNLMSNDRHRSQFGAHCIFNANMLMTGNLSALDPFVLATWGNAEAVAINQDTSHTFVQLPLVVTSPTGAVGDNLPVARVVECGGEPSAQNWTFNSPAPGFLTNAANRVCLNVDACGTSIVYDGCTTTGSTCAGKGKFSNEQWSLDAGSGALTSALPGGLCATVAAAAGGTDGDDTAPPLPPGMDANTVYLSPCQRRGSLGNLSSLLPSSQTWRYTAATGELVSGSGLCLTVPLPTPPTLESFLVGRQLQDGSWALLAVNNAANASTTLACGPPCLQAMGFTPGQTLQVRDVWAHEDLPPTSATTLTLPANPNGGSVFWRLHA